MDLDLIAGDYFISLGVADFPPEADEALPLDRRFDMIHMHVHPDGPGFGLVDFKAELEELDGLDSQPAEALDAWLERNDLDALFPRVTQ